MSKPLKASFAALLISTVSLVFLRYDSGYALELVRVEVPDNAIRDQLRKLLLERRQILNRIAQDMEVRLKHGVGNISEYGQAKKAALLAGIDLCNTGGERIEIYQEIVKLYKELEEHDKRCAEAGMIGQEGLHAVRVARLEAEIDLLREN